MKQLRTLLFLLFTSLSFGQYLDPAQVDWFQVDWSFFRQCSSDGVYSYMAKTINIGGYNIVVPEGRAISMSQIGGYGLKLSPDKTKLFLYGIISQNGAAYTLTADPATSGTVGLRFSGLQPNFSDTGGGITVTSDIGGYGMSDGSGYLRPPLVEFTYSNGLFKLSKQYVYRNLCELFPELPDVSSSKRAVRHK